MSERVTPKYQPAAKHVLAAALVLALLASASQLAGALLVALVTGSLVAMVYKLSELRLRPRAVSALLFGTLTVAAWHSGPKVAGSTGALWAVATGNEGSPYARWDKVYDCLNGYKVPTVRWLCFPRVRPRDAAHRYVESCFTTLHFLFYEVGSKGPECTQPNYREMAARLD